ncbi:MAG: DUF1223 domain-containing protein [Gammaproteobacteria bacterium]|nr:DUF1223 domain-containing protein [Gammaproteobacteria bacterium]MDH3466666.1 DUF1223 domain-containing protein [Gammaproteobacteria bacterium]
MRTNFNYPLVKLFDSPRARCGFVAAMLTAITLTTQAESIDIASSNDRVTLVELYTSEGCSSCPPADRWLSTLKDDAGLWRDFVPVAFHVDYWDYIGWPDRFASATYTARQRQNGARNKMRTVYTPGFFVDGSEWRGWFRNPTLRSHDTGAAGLLTLNIESSMITARFTPPKDTKDGLILNIALLGSDLVTAVKAGENRDRQLRHDFAVLGYRHVVMHQEDGGYTVDTELPKNQIEGTDGARLAIAAWVSRKSDDVPVQAAGGWL